MILLVISHPLRAAHGRWWVEHARHRGIDVEVLAPPSVRRLIEVEQQAAATEHRVLSGNGPANESLLTRLRNRTAMWLREGSPTARRLLPLARRLLWHLRKPIRLAVRVRHLGGRRPAAEQSLDADLRALLDAHPIDRIVVLDVVELPTVLAAVGELEGDRPAVVVR